MTSKRVQELLIKRYEHFKFFSRFQPRKKTKFQPENQYHKIFLTLKILVNSNLSRKNVECKRLNFNREQIKKMEPNQPTTMLMSEQVKRLKDIGQQRQQSFQSKQSKANQCKHSKAVKLPEQAKLIKKPACQVSQPTNQPTNHLTKQQPTNLPTNRGADLPN